MTVIRREITLDGYVLPVRIGLHADERRGPQPVRFDVSVAVAAERPPVDEPHTVLDYDRLREDVAAAAGARRYNLLETLCETILERFAARPLVEAARVTASKTQLYGDGSSVRVSLDWRRAP